MIFSLTGLEVETTLALRPLPTGAFMRLGAMLAKARSGRTRLVLLWMVGRISVGGLFEGVRGAQQGRLESGPQVE